MSKKTRLKIADKRPLEFEDVSFWHRRGQNAHVRGKLWSKLLKKGLSGSRFLSQNEQISTFLSSAKIPIVHRAKNVFVSDFKRWVVQDAVFTIFFYINKINNTFYQPRRNKFKYEDVKATQYFCQKITNAWFQ